MKDVYYVGLDVHKETIEMSVFRNWDKEPEFEKRIANGTQDLIKIIRKLKKHGKVETCYEAGCMGFNLKRELDNEGIECRIVSPGKIPRKPTERIKTDRRDARLLAKTLRAGEAAAIHVPTIHDETVRDYIRARDDVKLDMRRAKQQLLNYLLRLGYRYENNRYWKGKHLQWMKGIKFSDTIQEETFTVYFTRIVELEERLGLMGKRIREFAESERYKSNVGKLRCLKGIDYLTALALVTEVGDFQRFKNAESFMSYLGLVPREQSSGEKRRQGGITKSGNGHLRRLLVEASWHYRYHAVPSKQLVSRREGQGFETIAYADRAMRRLQRKFSKIVFRGKSKNVAVTAVSREMAGFIWGLMTGNIA